MAKSHIISLNLLADLKTQMGNGDNIVITTGQNTIGDGKGALYYWDNLSVETEDTVAWNIVQVTGNTTGRWKKVFTRRLTLPHGILFINNGKREFFCNTTTDASSLASVNLTMDNTTNGTPIFTSILFDDSKANIDAATSNDAVSGCRKSLSANLKQLVHIFYRGGAATISILGANVLGFRNAVTGTPITFYIQGE